MALTHRALVQRSAELGKTKVVLVARANAVSLVLMDIRKTINKGKRQYTLRVYPARRFDNLFMAQINVIVR